MARGDAWRSPSARCAELIASGARLMLDAPEIFEEIDGAVLAASGEPITSDPTLTASIRATDTANMVHWLTSNIRAPGERVAANVGPETLGLARDLVRRGLDDRATEAYRAGQNVAWRHWMELAFALTSDLDELHELLDVTAQSIFAFIDDTLAGIVREIDRERETLTSGTEAERLEVVSLIVAGAPIPPERASARLQYELRRRHVATILWSTAASPDQSALGHAADAIARAAGAGRALTLAPSSASLWTWFAAEQTPSAESLATALQDAPAVRVAIGSASSDVAGFRRSHLDALAAQRLMHRSRDDVSFARYDDVRAAILASADEDSARVHRASDRRSRARRRRAARDAADISAGAVERDAHGCRARRAPQHRAQQAQARRGAPAGATRRQERRGRARARARALARRARIELGERVLAQEAPSGASLPLARTPIHSPKPSLRWLPVACPAFVSAA